MTKYIAFLIDPKDIGNDVLIAEAYNEVIKKADRMNLNSLVFHEPIYLMDEFAYLFRCTGND
jgi:hypothetical protein